MKTPISFEIAKLFKEKGFDEPVKKGYDKNGKDYIDEHWDINYNTHPYSKEVCSAPTIADVVMWLYEKKGIWIVAYPELFNREIVKFYPSIFKKGVGEDIEQYYNSPTEAYLEAITYTLNHLI